ncbi:uncharacterized protein METZ01_LOCUS111750, partial [marine metagenome]
ETMLDWIDWLVDDSSVGKAAPIGDATRSEIVKDLSKSENLLDLGRVLQLKPSDPVLLSNFAYYLLANSGMNEANKRRATYHINKAREFGERNAFVYYRSAQVEKMLSNQEDALRYIDRAIELGSGNAEYSEFKKSLLQNN